ncbi:hypothetical protein HK102_007152 [Quaeritorhiza haematococci]|nr:hypothetical protein HK102_007152 [Quaeritorhiza haematococci]
MPTAILDPAAYPTTYPLISATVAATSPATTHLTTADNNNLSNGSSNHHHHTFQHPTALTSSPQDFPLQLNNYESISESSIPRTEPISADFLSRSFQQYATSCPPPTAAMDLEAFRISNFRINNNSRQLPVSGDLISNTTSIAASHNLTEPPSVPSTPPTPPKPSMWSTSSASSPLLPMMFHQDQMSQHTSPPSAYLTLPPQLPELPASSSPMIPDIMSVPSITSTMPSMGTLAQSISPILSLSTSNSSIDTRPTSTASMFVSSSHSSVPQAATLSPSISTIMTPGSPANSPILTSLSLDIPLSAPTQQQHQPIPPIIPSSMPQQLLHPPIPPLPSTHPLSTHYSPYQRWPPNSPRRSRGLSLESASAYLLDAAPSPNTQHAMATAARMSPGLGLNLGGIAPRRAHSLTGATYGAIRPTTRAPYGSQTQKVRSEDPNGVYEAVYSHEPVYEFMCRGIAVMRRQRDSWINATHILKVAGIDKGRRTKILERELNSGGGGGEDGKQDFEKVQGGYGRFQGTWVPLEVGRRLATNYSVDEILRPILELPSRAPEPKGDSASSQ